jgi:hypothetical protein
VDARTPVRRLQVTRHPDRGLVVLSLWQGDHCTGTFRLRVGDSPALVHTLVDGLSAALADDPTAAPPAAWLDRIRSRLRRRGEVIRRFASRR